LGLLLNRAQKWAYIHIPKTGGTSLTNILNKIDGTETIAVHDSIRALNDVSKFFIFTIVRNPYTRMVSAYLHRLRKNEFKYDFQTFLKTYNENHLDILPQSYYINAGRTEDKQVSYIARYENYEDEIKKLLNKLNHNSKIPHLNKNPIYDKHPTLKQEMYYNAFYTEDWMKNIIKERYENDFKIFNYGLDLSR